MRISDWSSDVCSSDLIQRLARDAEDVVACPVLEFSPLLSEEDLLEIIASAGLSSRLCAISRRRNLGEAISDAIVQRNDREAVSELLANGSAQIREETLDSLIAASVKETDRKSTRLNSSH